MVVHNHPSGVMRTPDICGVGGATFDVREPERTWTRHNHSPSRNASNWSLARYRQRPLDGSCTFSKSPFFHREVGLDIQVRGVEAFVLPQARER